MFTARERFEKRQREKRFWFFLGKVMFVFSMSGLFVAISISFLITFKITSYSFYKIVDNLVSLSVPSLIFSVFCILVLSQLGWSKSIWIDLLLNRLSSILVIIGSSLSFFTGIISNEIIIYGQPILAIGIILWLLGLRFRSGKPEI